MKPRCKYLIIIWFLFLLTSCGKLTSNNEKININEFPIYPNSNNLEIIEITNPNGFEDNVSWVFLSDDASGMIWDYYVKNLSKKWGFEDISWVYDESVYALYRATCPNYLFRMWIRRNKEGMNIYTIKLTEKFCV